MNEEYPPGIDEVNYWFDGMKTFKFDKMMLVQNLYHLYRLVDNTMSIVSLYNGRNRLFIGNILTLNHKLDFESFVNTIDKNSILSWEFPCMMVFGDSNGSYTGVDYEYFLLQQEQKLKEMRRSLREEERCVEMLESWEVMVDSEMRQFTNVVYECEDSK